jgi:transposase|tara:strand:- start:5150 stop:5434 length:285 start_codon:yes stop_codon:yes gene_type:complete
MSRRKYTDEYKREAVELTRLPGATVTAVARDLGINAHMLGKWRTAIEKHGQEAFPGQGHARDEEIMQLKRELARVKKERDFLKEAAAFFAREQK